MFKSVRPTLDTQKDNNTRAKVRYMNAKGLKRKFDADNYVEMVKEGKP